jgi:cell division protein FtsQ
MSAPTGPTRTRALSGASPAPGGGSGTSSVARFADRARRVRWRARRRALLWGLAAVAVVALAAVLWTGPLLVVRSVDVQAFGGPPLTAEQAEQVRASAGVPMRRPLARVDTSAVLRRASRVPFVAQVMVQRAWPSTLRLQVRQRVPVAAVPTSQGSVQLVDEEGTAYARVAEAPSGVPVVSVELGGIQGRATLDAALQVLEQMPPSLRTSVRRVRATSPDSVRLRVDGADVVWGSADRTPRKAEIYAALRSVDAKVYDVSSPDTPVTR